MFSRALLVAGLVCLVCPLLSVSAFFALNSPKLVIERLDPLINPGGLASHLHTVLGGSNWSDRYEYNTSFASDCTTMPVSVDKSNYWTPTLYYVYPNQSLFEVVPLGFGRIYYLPRPGPTQKNKIVAFPKGFRMVAGDMNRRTYNKDRQMDNAISFVCLDYYGNHQGDPEWAQRNDFFTKHNCPNGMRLQFNFPACWDGVNLYKEDNSHVAYTIQNVDSGDCPSTHPVHFVNLFFEFIYDTQKFPINSNGVTWALSNGDTTGYGFHGDFTNGWDVDVLQAALDQCDDAGGDPARCAPFAPYMQNGAEFCHPSKQILNEKVGLNGKPIAYLPGCNKLWFGTGPKPTCDADWPGLNPPGGKVGYEPVASVLPDGWSRLGCFAKGPSGDALTGASADFPDDNSGGKCAAFCMSQGFSIAATKYEHQCICGNQMTNGASLSVNAPGNKCPAVCPGRYTESCGGNDYMQVMINPSMRSVNTAASALPTGWFRDGCVAEPSGSRLFTGASLQGDDMTPAKCVAFCSNVSLNKKANFTYAGTEYGRECYCSSTLPSSATPRADDAKCSMACKGASSLQCGGPAYMSLYSLRPQWKVAELNNTVLPVSWKPVGCFRIGAATATAQLTKAPFFTDSAMSNSMCAARCAQFKASYAVTQYGSQCFCGDANSIALETVASKKLAPEQCDITCSGNVLERCGGLDTSSVMLTGQPGAGAVPAGMIASSTGAAAPNQPAEKPKTAKLRIKVDVKPEEATTSLMSTIRFLVAQALKIDVYRVLVEVEGSGSAYAGRRLLQASADSTMMVVSFLGATSADGDAAVSSDNLAVQFQAGFADKNSDLSRSLAAQGVNSEYQPEKVNDTGNSGSGDSNAASSNSSDGKTIGIIVGVVVGAVVLMAAITAAVLIARRRQASKSSMDKMNKGTSGSEMYKV